MAEQATIEKREAEAAEIERVHGGRTYVPAVDIIETKEEMLLIADTPGARAEGIEINYERGRLTIEARVQPRQSEDRTQYLLREYGVGDFSRSFDVGEGIDASKIEAEIADGVLTLHLPKAAELQPRKIAVKAST
jgi:HSP20 family molecular chaperone IbpA